ncbi:MAG: hypothetical protein NTU98_15035 [Bacteroidetes bacterium]|nr:hypothetical protein [Bacteroidota bacterium]
MKKQIFALAILLISSVALFSQTSQGDIQIIQKYFGVQKATLLKEYMMFTPHQDSAFWPVYNKYENERLALGSQRVAMIDEYMKAIENITEAKATEMVDKGVALEIKFKNLQKKYFTEMAKKIGPVKAAQFYQFENYINNVINLTIQESIPFVGELEQKHAGTTKKK